VVSGCFGGPLLLWRFVVASKVRDFFGGLRLLVLVCSHLLHCLNAMFIIYNRHNRGLGLGMSSELILLYVCLQEIFS